MQTVTRNAKLALSVASVAFPTAQLEKNGFDLVRVRFLQCLTRLTKALAPDFHGTDTGSLHGAFFGLSTELITIEVIATLEKVILVPAFR